MSEGNNQSIPPAPVDDSPLLRSVALPLRGGGDRLQVEAPPPGMSKLAPLKAFSLPPKPPGTKTPAWGLKQEWSASTPVWNIRAEDLEPLPPDFPLEKTHREIYEDVSVVTARISDALRALSVESSYCPESVKVTCKTEDCVSFKIRLFAGGDGCQPIIVEVQKRSGPAFCFVRTCRALLTAIEGHEMKAGCRLRGPKTFPKPLCQLKCLQGVIKEQNDNDVEAHLSTANRLFNSDRGDERTLALENLSCLTDPIKSSPLVSLNVSKKLLKDDDMRNKVLLLSNRLPSRNGFVDQALHLSLTVLGNACSVCGSNGCLSEMVEQDDWFCNTLIPVLLAVVDQAKDHSTSAYQATRSLFPLLMCSEKDISTRVANSRDILTSAHEFGSRFHYLLEFETKRCLKEIDKLCV